MQVQIQKIETSERSSMRDDWSEVVRTIATNVDEVLRNRFDGIYRLIEDPGANHGVLVADKNSVDAAIAEASELARRLDGIGIMAGGYLE